MKTIKIYTSKGLEQYKYSTAKNLQYTKFVHENLIQKFNELNLSHIELEGNNIWCRDYLPVKGVEDKYVLFEYNPIYNIGTKSGEQQINDAKIAKQDWKKKNPTIKVLPSELVLDGGAIDVSGDICLVSTRVFTDNPKMTSNKIEKELHSKLGVEKVFYIPEHPYDFTGHVDGLARLVDSETILINDLSKEYEYALEESKTPRGKLMIQWIHSFNAAIHNTGLDIKELTYNAENNKGMDAGGVYMNYLKIGKHILMPSFDDNANNEDAKKRLEKLFIGYTVHSIPATELARQGGIINCVTWQDE